MSDDGILFKGLALMALLSIVAGLFVVASMAKGGADDHYTAMYMSTSAIDRNITKNHTSLTIPFTIENHEGTDANYHYDVSILFKDTIFHSGIDSWSEDLNVDQKNNVTSGSITVNTGTTGVVQLTVPVQSSLKWRYANVTIDLYKDGTPGIYRSLRLWAFNQSTS